MRYIEQLPETVTKRYERHTVEELKDYARHILALFKDAGMKSGKLNMLQTGFKLPTKKPELVTMISACMEDMPFIRYLYKQLDPLEQSAVQEAVHSESGTLDSDRFRAKYGRLPNFRKEAFYWINTHKKEETFPLLSLLISEGSMPKDLQKRFETFVPAPKSLTVSYPDELPESVSIFGGEKTVPLIRHTTENAALRDMTAVLQLIDTGKVGVSPATGRPTQSGINAIRAALSDLCILAGNEYLVVPNDKETRFRSALRKMGYGIASNG